MKSFCLGLLLGSLVPAIAIYFAGGSRSACAIIGTLVPLAIALKFPRAIGRALLWIAGERSEAQQIDADFLVKKIAGHEIYEGPDGFSVPSLDRDSTFDTVKDAARFIGSAGCMIHWPSYILGLSTGLLLAVVAFPVTRTGDVLLVLAIALAAFYIVLLRREPRDEINQGEKHNGEDPSNPDR